MKLIEFISQNLGTILVLLVLLAAVAAIVIARLRAKKQGGSGCGSGCSGCPFSGKCHGAVEKQADTAEATDNPDSKNE